MLEFYTSLARRLPSVLRESIETVGFWLALAASILAFFSPELAAKAGAAVPGWARPIPFIIFALHLLFEAAHSEITSLETTNAQQGDDCVALRQECGRLRAQVESRTDRKELIANLNAHLKEGMQVRDVVFKEKQPTDETKKIMNRWIFEVQVLLEKEAPEFTGQFRLPVPGADGVLEGSRVRSERYRTMANRLQRLGEIIAEMRQAK